MYFKLLLCATVYLATVVGASASRSDEDVSDWTLVRLPVCSSRELASQVYWSAEQYGTLMAEVFYFTPLQNKGLCGWYDLFVPEAYLFQCRLDWSFDCDAVEWQARDGKVFLIVWPK